MTSDHRRDPILDLIRALAAGAVCIHHARNLFFWDYTPDLGLLAKGFYFISNFGPQAVIIFFVLSGYFVGGSVLRQVETKRWSCTDYALNRLTRLWMVVVPALVLTWLLDYQGITHFFSAFYAGTEGNALLKVPTQSALNISTFVCNVAFLQTLECRTFGSNGALWSLANEFWYYVWFPCLMVVFRRSYKSSILLLIAIAALATLYAFSSLIEGFSLWLLGVLSYVIAKRAPIRTIQILRNLRWLTLALFLSVLIASRFLKQHSDLLVGIAFFPYFTALVSTRPIMKSRLLQSVSIWLSDQSFSLYVLHMPLLVFAMSAFFGHRARFTVHGLISFVLLVGAIYCCTFLSYLLFEKNTPWLRRRLGSGLNLLSARIRTERTF